MPSSLTEKTKKNLIASYVNGTIKAKDKSIVEALIGQDPIYARYYERKQLEREFVLQMIPQEKLLMQEKIDLTKELSKVTKELLLDEPTNWSEQVKDFLDRPFISINF